MPTSAPPSHPLIEHLWALSVALEARLTAELAEVGLTLAELRLVGEVIRASDGVRQGELAARLDVTAPTVSAAVTRLERAGVLQRTADPMDPRARLVRVAPDAPLGPGLEVLDALEARAWASLSRAQRRDVLALLDRLTLGLRSGD